jgi:hypothetical protein
MLFKNAAWITLNGNANGRNNTYQSLENSHAIRDFTFHNHRFRARCTVSTRKITGPACFEETKHFYRYVLLILTSFFRQLWHPRSRNLHPCDYCGGGGGTERYRVYVNNTHSLQKTKDDILKGTATVSRQKKYFRKVKGLLRPSTL